jgi:hypothetical protein
MNFPGFRDHLKTNQFQKKALARAVPEYKSERFCKKRDPYLE